MAIRRKQIRQVVQDILAKHKIKSAPVDVEKIVKALKISISLESVNDELSGFLYRDKKANRAVIGANKAHHENRQRFTIAHELGHFLLHEGETIHLDSGPRNSFTINLRNTESAKGEDDDEREANLFAAELLMPADFLAKDLEGQDLDIFEENTFLPELASKYKVSVQALTFRLANLGYINL